MLKLRYDSETGEIGAAYPSTFEVPEPYIEITEEEHSEIKSDTENIYFVTSEGEFETKNRLVVEAEKKFKQEFFKTTIGYIRFNPTFKDGSKKDFVGNCLPNYATQVQLLGSLPANSFLYYDEPDFSQPLTEEYLLSLQHGNPEMSATDFLTFFTECGEAYKKAFTG